MKIHSISGVGKFFVGVMVGAVVFSGTAVAVNSFVSDNTPENGYLLCANNKTKAVTFPNKLNCPSGSTPLDMGAAVGSGGPEGPEGPAGPQGPNGSDASVTNYYKKVTERDVVVDGTITDSTKAKKVVMGAVISSDLPLGYYRLDAHMSGLWSDTVFNASSKPYVKCYFQSKTDYDSGSKSIQWGSAKLDYVNWTGITFNVQGYAWFLKSTDSPVYLVCETSGNIKDFGGMIEALSASGSRQMNSASTSGMLS
jgi:hypothetical protein